MDVGSPSVTSPPPLPQNQPDPEATGLFGSRFTIDYFVVGMWIRYRHVRVASGPRRPRRLVRETLYGKVMMVDPAGPHAEVRPDLLGVRCENGDSHTIEPRAVVAIEEGRPERVRRWA